MQQGHICVEPDRNVRRLSGSRRAHPQRQAQFEASQASHVML
jgi:hypothetical protein